MPETLSHVGTRRSKYTFSAPTEKFLFFQRSTKMHVGPHVICNLCSSLICEASNREARYYWHYSRCLKGYLNFCRECLKTTEHELRAQAITMGDVIPFFGNRQGIGMTPSRDEDRYRVLILVNRAKLSTTLCWRLLQDSANLCEECQEIKIHGVFLGNDVADGKSQHNSIIYHMQNCSFYEPSGQRGQMPNIQNCLDRI